MGLWDVNVRGVQTSGTFPELTKPKPKRKGKR